MEVVDAKYEAKLEFLVGVQNKNLPWGGGDYGVCIFSESIHSKRNHESQLIIIMNA